MEFVIVTGLSGSGKSSAVKVLEDIGYFCIDNMPPQLIPDFASMCNENNDISKVAIVTDIRGGAMFFKLGESITTLHIRGIDVKGLFLDKASDGMIVSCMSFGFKYGAPGEADLVFDVRCLPNPFYLPELKEKTGLDREVRDYVMSFEQSQTLRDKLFDLIDFLIPHYVTEGKSRLVIAFGCTGGKHRSVTFAELTAKHLREHDFKTRILHRDAKKK